MGNILFFFLALTLMPAFSATLDVAMQKYEAAQASYEQAKDQLLAKQQALTKAQGALQRAKVDLDAKQQQLADALATFKIAQAYQEKNPWHSISRERKAYRVAWRAHKTAQQTVRQQQQEVTTAQNQVNQHQNIVQRVAERVNSAAGQVAAARFAKIKKEFAEGRTVEVAVTYSCGGNETFNQCKASALKRVLAKAAREGAAVYVQSLSKATYNGSWRLEENITSKVTGKIGQYQVLVEYFTRTPGIHIKIRAKVQGQVPENLQVGLSPPLTDGTVPKVSVIARTEKRSPKSFEPEVVSIPAGCFMMGSPKSEKDRDSDEGPLHRVCVKAFKMGKYEITTTEYAAFLNARRPSTADRKKWVATKAEYSSSNHLIERNGQFQAETGYERYPVNNVSWYGAVAYLQWLSQQTGKNYRLPTEAEWEYAARGGTQTRYWWGDEDPVCQKGARNGAKFYGCSAKETEAVGSYQANQYGLYDVHGNLWEWTCSGWSNPYNGSEKKCLLSGASARVFRGGSWDFDADDVRAASRYRDEPGNQSDDVGFRACEVQVK